MNVSKSRLLHRFPGKQALVNKLCSEAQLYFKFPTRALENICDWLIEEAAFEKAEAFWRSFEVMVNTRAADRFFQDIGSRFGELQTESVQLSG